MPVAWYGVSWRTLQTDVETAMKLVELANTVATGLTQTVTALRNKAAKAGVDVLAAAVATVERADQATAANRSNFR